MPYWTKTHVGIKRKNNEDAFLAKPELGLFGVADGMGGHAAGEVASGEAVRSISEYLTTHRELISQLGDPTDRAARAQLMRLLAASVRNANQSIHAKARSVPRQVRMGTTFCGGLVSDRQALIVNVGDSRAYLSRQKKLHLLTQDHTLAYEQLRRGMISEEQAETSSNRNILLRALGIEPVVDPDVVPVDLRPGDRLLFCTDGVSNQVDASTLARFMVLSDGGHAVSRMIEQANVAGGKDNATAVLVEVGTFGRTGEHLIDPEAQIKAMWHLSLFHHLEYHELVKVMAVTKPHVYQAGEVVFQEGQPGDFFVVVVSGLMDVSSGGKSLTAIQPGEHVGELALLDGLPRSATVVARERTKVLLISRDDFYQLIRREPLMASKLLWRFGVQMANRIRELTPRVQ